MKTGNAQLKTSLRGPGKVLICRAATEAGTDPDRVKFKRTVRIVRRRAADPAAFPP